MERYRIAFFLALTAAVLLAVALGIMWFKPEWVSARAPVSQAAPEAAPGPAQKGEARPPSQAASP
jgi:hypothetical protein